MRIDQVRRTLRERIVRGANEADGGSPARRRRRFRERARRVDDVRTVLGRSGDDRTPPPRSAR